MTNQKNLSCGAGRFDISTAGLHILAMTLMLMDHLWATLLPAQEWLTCAGRLAYPIFAFMAVKGTSTPAASENTRCGCWSSPCCPRFRSI